MNMSDVRPLFAYTEWANARIFECVDGLPEEQYTRTIESSFPSIAATLAHVISAEWVWLRRWKGESPLAVPDWAGGASREVLHGKLRDVEAERAAFLDTLTDDALTESFSYRSVKGDPFTRPLGITLQHVANHSTHHRGQLTTMLRQAGAVPPSTDFTLFFTNAK